MIVTLLRKPLEGSVADNVLEHGCGALNIDATRVGYATKGRWPANFILTHLDVCIPQGEDWACVEGCPVRELDRQSGHQKSGIAGSKSRAWGVAGKGQLSSTEDGVGWKAYGSEGYGDEGGASRFFKQFKETK
jgi:site-specific DNA-methyltransferase (adenine-specific)